VSDLEDYPLSVLQDWFAFFQIRDENSKPGGGGGGSG
jgi:hypothetical protein